MAQNDDEGLVVAKKIVSRLRFSLRLSPFFARILKQLSRHVECGATKFMFQDGVSSTGKENTLNICLKQDFITIT